MSRMPVLVLAVFALGGVAAAACSSAPATSGLAEAKALSALSDGELGQLCDWAASQYGGYGKTHSCKGETFTSSPDRATCVAGSKKEAAAPGCSATVSDIETVARAIASCSADRSAAPSFIRVADCSIDLSAPTPAPTFDAGVTGGGTADGGALPAPSCHGSLACRDVSNAACASTPGCTFTPESCSGTPSSCSNFQDATACADQTGCVWSNTTLTCSGAPAPCATLTGDACIVQGGCTQAFAACSGTVTKSCDTHTTPAECSGAPDCAWY